MDRPIGEFDTPKSPHSPYEAELQRDSLLLRFAPPLEREFRSAHLQRIGTRVRVWQVLALLLALLSALFELVTEPPAGHSALLLCLGALVPASALMTALAWGRHFERWYLSVAAISSAAIGVALSVLIAAAMVAGSGEALLCITTNLLAAFFLVGLLFFDACLVALLSLMAFAVAGAIYGIPLSRLIYDSLLLAVATAISAGIAYGAEQANRRFFLERGVLGDLAERDGLTGLHNRRAFDEHLTRVWQQSLRDQSSLAILMIDLDYFKAYNDQYGHQAGDHCLRHVAQVVQRFARRPLDLAARYGGEELSVVLYQVTVEQAQTIAEQLRGTIAGERIEHRGSPMHGIVTVSIGVAWTEATPQHSSQDTVQVADEALYAAKLGGRNRIIYQGADQAHTFTATLRRAPRLRPVR